MLALEETQQIHAHIIKTGFGLDIYATNSLLHVYAISTGIKYAHLLFDRLPHWDIVSWIDGYTKSGDITKDTSLISLLVEINTTIAIMFTLIIEQN